MSAPQITITPAGFAAIVNAEHDGTAPIRITHVGVTAQAFDVNTVGTTVPAEVKRITTFGGKAVSADTLHLNVRDDSQDTYTLRGFGLYLANGVLFAVYSQATPIMEKAAAATLLLATDIRFAKIDATSIDVADVDFINPPATTTQVGVSRFATDLEAAGGALSTVGITPKGVATYVDVRFGPGAPSPFMKGLMGIATAGLLRVAIGIKSAALKDEGIGNGLDADLLDGQHGDYYLKWDNLSGVPTQFNPVAHQHGMGDVTGLSDALAGKAPSIHSHAISQISGLQAAIDSKVNKAGDTMSGQLHINGNALRVSNWGGTATAGVVYFGAGNSFIQKTGVEFQFYNQEGGYLAKIVRGGNVLTSEGDQAISAGTLRVCPAAGADQLFMRLEGAAGVTIDSVNSANSAYAPIAIRGSAVNLNGPVSASGDITISQNYMSFTANVVLATGTAGNVYLRPNGANSSAGQMVVNSAGYVTLSSGLSASGDVNINGSLNLTGIFNRNTGSSERLKDIEGPLPYGLAEVRRIRTVIGSYKPEYCNDQSRRLFVVAEQLATIIKEAVREGAIEFQGDKVAAVEYELLIPVLINAVAQLADQVDAIRARHDG